MPRNTITVLPGVFVFLYHFQTERH